MKILKNYFFISTILILTLAGCGHSPTKQELEATYANAPSKFIVIDGTRIHYRDEGNGPTIILLHGVLASLHTWDGWADDLKKDHRVIRFDVPAFGLTGKMGNDDYSMANYLNVIDKFIIGLNAPKKFTMVGNSLGGLLAWNYAVSHPDRVEKLALLDSGAYPQELPFVLKFMIAPIIRNTKGSFIPKFMVRHNLEGVYGDPNNISPEKLQLYYDINHYPGTFDASVKLFQYLDSISKADPPELAQLKNLKMPVLIMWGEKDHWVPFNLRWKSDLPNARYIFYPGVGHIPMEEIPKKSVEDFRAWYSN